MLMPADSVKGNNAGSIGSASNIRSVGSVNWLDSSLDPWNYIAVSQMAQIKSARFGLKFLARVDVKGPFESTDFF